MAGRKQHYIPQSVQRGFEARHTGLKTQVYVYQKSGASYLTSTDGAAAERDFYSNPLKDGRGALDDRITDFESDELNLVLKQLRSIEHGPVNTELAAIAVAHLTARTAHLRGTFAFMFDGALDQIQSIVAEPTSVRNFAGIDATSGSELNERIRAELAQLSSVTLPAHDREALERMVTFRLRERFDDLFDDAKDILKDQLATFKARVPETIATGHTRALSESLVSEVRAQGLRKLAWRVVPANSGDRRFLLPDCVAIGKAAPSDDFQPFALLGTDQIATVVMPISSQQLLVGGEYHVEQDEINLNFAACCLKFFISSCESDSLKAAAQFIGAFSANLNMDLFEEGHVPNAKPISVTGFCGRLRIRTPSGKFGEVVKKAVASIVHETIDAAVLSSIESISVPSSMGVALEAILRRPPSDDELKAAAFGVAVPIKSGSRWKTRILIPRHVAQYLVQSASPQQVVAKRVIKINLGRAYYLGCWARQCPEIFERHDPMMWRHIMLTLSFNFASQYAGAIATHGEIGQSLQDEAAHDELASNIVVALSSLESVRLRYMQHLNVEQLAVEAAAPLDALLGTVAALAGFAEADGVTLKEYTRAAQALSQAALFDWAVLFSKDLSRHYEQRDRWTSEKDLDQLAGHAERILWTIGVFATPVKEGYRINVCDDIGLSRVKQVLSQ